MRFLQPLPLHGTEHHGKITGLLAIAVAFAGITCGSYERSPQTATAHVGNVSPYYIELMKTALTHPFPDDCTNPLGMSQPLRQSFDNLSNLLQDIREQALENALKGIQADLKEIRKRESNEITVDYATHAERAKKLKELQQWIDMLSGRVPTQCTPKDFRELFEKLVYAYQQGNYPHANTALARLFDSHATELWDIRDSLGFEASKDKPAARMWPLNWILGNKPKPPQADR